MSTPWTVLVIADTQEQANPYSHQLQQDGTVAYNILLEPYNSAASFLPQTLSVDGILLGLSWSQSDSLALLRQLKAQMGDRCPPIVIVDSGNTKTAVQAIKHGAADYLVRDQTTPDDLRLAMRSAIENAELRQALHRSQAQFQTSVENMLDCFGIFSALRDGAGQIVDFRIDYLNGAACDSNQMPRSMQIGRGLCEVLPGHRESGLFEEYCRVVETGEPLVKDSLIYDDAYGDRRLIRAFDLRATRLNDGFVASWRDVTERCQIEHDLQRALSALQASQQQSRDLAEAMPQIVWTADAAGAVNYWNQRWYDYTGLGEAESFGLAGVQAVQADQRQRTLDAWSQAIASGETFEIEHQIRGREGEYRWFINRAVPTQNSQGQITGWIGTITDIDGQKQTEIALQQQQNRLNLAMKAAKMGSWDWNIQAGQVHWSTNLEHLFGMAAGSFDGRLETVKAMIHPEDLPKVEQAIDRAVYGRDDYNIEFRFIKPDGTVCWVLSMGRVFYDASDTPLMMAGIDRDISARKAVEAALRLSEERYRTLFESMHEGFCVVEMLFDQHDVPIDYRFLEVNAVFEQQTGLVNAVGQTARQLLPDLEPHWFEIYGRVALTGEPARFENGSVVMRRWFEVSAFRIGPPEGRTVAILFKEVSERKQAELSLQESEARFRTLADNIAPLAWMANELGWIFWYNQRWFDYTGTTLEAMQGDGWRAVHHPDHVDRVVEKINRCFQTGEIWEDSFPLRGRDGDYRWFLSRAIPVRDEQGNVFRWLGTNTDITDRQLAENALRQSEERYRYLVETIPQLVWTASSDGTLLDVNERWVAFTGLTLEQARAAGWEQIVHPDDLTEMGQRWSAAVSLGTPYQAEGRIRRADGTYHWHLHQAIPQQNEQGQITKWFGTATDIEVQKQLEHDRDRLLQQEQGARHAAERANRIKDEFLAILSHELRSPLNPILGWAKLLQMHKLDEAKTAAGLATIERNAKLQAQLIDDLLDVAKILRGKLSLTMAAVDLAAVVEAAIDTVRPMVAAKAIGLNAVLPNIGQVSGDAARLQQVVWNLLSNAIKFSPTNGQVEIRLTEVDGSAEITVRDWGKGINPDFLPYMFESFRQEDGSTTRTYGGLGLGLAIVRELVEAHRGLVTAESPGEQLGATFTVRLPLIQGVPTALSVDELPAPALDLTGTRVLAVDDDPDSRELLTTILTQYGAEVLTVTSAAAVLENLSSFQPDVLVSDIGMPNVDGYSLLRQIRALPPAQGGQTPAVALTAYAREDDRRRAIASGFQHHVTKPLEPKRLVQAVITLTRQRPTLAPGPE
ncbi:PAS domain-containing protein [Nodosilinea sp. E11]|uniref:PAS domain-containing protein n=1 Tax=Nodosilinea sp. E11 TaxID=3037479 RepID=UPI0029344040|nr:PAS domain-containing protein [Nodosilinea sp. E11]WOD41807.1 PAS domain-containing protein [Nodosilinea sp. E11]